MKKLIFVSAILLAQGLTYLYSQQVERADGVIVNPEAMPCEYLGLTKAFRDVVIDSTIELPITKKPKLGYHAKDDWYLNPNVNPNALPVDGDPIRQTKYNTSTQKSTQIANWAGMNTNTNPGDPAMDVGPNHVVQMMNGFSGARVQIWDKSGNTLLAASDFSTMAGGSWNGLGDPIVIYDERADRWMLTEFCDNCNNMYIAVSQTADPLGAYHLYSVTANSFPDYPKYSIWDDSYLITANEGNSTTSVYILNRTAMLSGGSPNAQRFTVPRFGTIGFQATTPVSLMGTSTSGTPAMLMRMRDDAWSGSATDALEIWELDINWSNPGGATLSQTQVLGVSPHESELCGYTSFSCIPQAGSNTDLDPLRELLMNRIMYRNFGSHESMVCSHVTDVDGNDLAGIRWYELRRTGGGSWTLYQEGTYAPNDGLHRWMPTIGISASGNIGLAYNVSSSSIHPEIRYTGRKECDPLGIMTETEIQLVDGTSPNNGNRWGDYNAMGVDPVDGETFWFTATYNPTSQARSRIGAFKIDPCVTTPPTCGITASTLTITEGSTVTFSDASTDTPTSWNWTFDNTGVGSTAPATSTSQNPGAVTFNSPGVYEVELAASNASGSCSTTVTITVTANTNPPVCGITTSTTSIVEGMTVDFADASTGQPTSWAWDFDNTSVGSASPATSTAQNPGTVTFNSPGSYQVELVATNTFGSCSTTVNITVNPSSGCDTLTNLLPAHNLTIYGSSNGGWVSGWNGYSDISKAEYYDNYSPFTHVTAAEVYFYGVADGGNGTTINLSVWDDNGGSPGTIIQSESFDLATISGAMTNGQGLVLMSFSSPVNVQGLPFYIGIEMNNFQNGDSLGIISNTFGESTVNTAWEQWDDNSWNDMENAWGSGTLSMYINPFVTDIPVSGTASSDLTSACINAPIEFSGSGTNITSYEWYFPGGSPNTSANQVENVSYASPGSYTAYLYLNGACEGYVLDSVEITITDGPTASVSTTDPGCSGNDGSVTITASGGVGPYTYSFDGSGFTSTSTYGSLSVGSYNVIVQDANGCQDNTTAVLNTGSGSISHTSSYTDPSCQGDTDGTITLSGSGGSSYTYSIDGGSTTQSNGSFTGLNPGSYDIVVEDGGCVSTETIVLSDPDAISFTASAVDPSCSTGTGTITITATGGTGTLQYSINGGSSFQSSNSFTGLTAGTYSLVIRDANNCQVTGSESINIPTSISMNSSSTSPLCSTGTGTISITASGGTGTLNYSINGGSSFQAGNTFTGLNSGTYNIVVEDANGCQVTGSESITVPSAINISSSSTNANCGNTDGTITITATGGTGTLLYSIDGGSNFQSSGIFTGLGATTYNIVVQDDNNCQQTATEIISNSSGPSISAINPSQPSCNGGSDGSISISASGVATLQYSIDGGTSFQSSNSFSNVSAGTYTVIVEDGNGCQTSSSVTVTEPTANTFNTSFSSPTCFGGNNGSISFNGATGPNPKRYSIDGGSTFQVSSNFTGLSAGIYNVAVRDGNGCIVYNTVVIPENNAISISSSSVLANCGNSDGSITITASGGTGSYQYSINNGVTFQSNSTFTGLAPGNYNLVVEDANGCQANGSQTVSNSSGPSISSSTPSNTTCNGGNDGSVTITATGTPTLQYSIDGGNTFQSSATFSGLIAGNYNFVVEDGAGCQTNTSATVNEPILNTFNSNISNPTCFGLSDGSIVFNSATGASPIRYSIDGGSNYQLSVSFTGLAAGTYSLSVRDNNGCTVTGTATLTSPSQITVSAASTVENCGNNDGTITITATGGTGSLSYSIDGGLTFQSSASFSNVSLGSYTIVVEDVNNCQASTSVNVGSNNGPSISSVSSSDVTCFGGSDGSITFTATGSGTLQYSVDGGSNWSLSNTISGLTAGAYSLYIQDGFGCQLNVGNITLTQPNEITYTASPLLASCGNSDGGLTLSSSGGSGALQYSIDGGSTFQSSGVFTGLASGSYSIVIKDANSCQITAAENVGSTSGATIDNETQTNVSCNGGNDGGIIITATGVATLAYSINGGSSYVGSGNFTGLNAGSYVVAVRDGNGCVTLGSNITITEPNAISYTATINDASCAGNDGSITLNAAGGTGALDYSIDGGSTFSSVNTFSGLSSGTFNIVIKDDNNCQVTGTETINSNTGPVISSEVSNDASCNGSSDGSILITASGSGNLTYSIDGGANFVSLGTFNGLFAGIYDVMVMDGNNCTTSGSTITINEPVAISFTSIVTATTCGNNNGGITFNAAGGTGTLQYSVDGGTSFQTSDIFTGLGSGTYSLVIKDNNNCQVIGSETITNTSGPIISNVSDNDITCNGASNGSIQITASGQAPLVYSIDGGSTFASLGSFNGLPVGNYSIAVRDANGCVTSGGSVSITEPSAILFSSSVMSASCGSNNGNITLSATGGTGALQYSIDGGVNFQVSGTFSGLASGNYSIVIKDANNCQSTGTETVGSASGPVITNISNNDVSCNGADDGDIVISANGNGTLGYSVDGGATYSTSGVFTNLAAGSYQVVIRDGNGCVTSGGAIIINEPVIITYTASITNATCGVADGSIILNATGGSGSFSYSINGGSTFQSGNTFNSIGTGTYNIVVRDNNNCQTSGVESINSQPGPTITGSAAMDIKCFGDGNGSITISSTGISPITYSINGGSSYQSSGTFSGLDAGIYIVNVMDGNGCVTNTPNLSITEPSAISVMTSTTDATCGNSDGAIDLSATGGTGALVYSIDGGVSTQSTGSFGSLVAGLYNIVVKDDNNCQYANSINVINADGPIIIDLNVTDETCFGDNDGSISVTATGTAPLTYSFNGGSYSSVSSINNVTGTITIDVQDGNNCVTSTNANIIEATDIQISAIVENATCGQNNGIATATVTGGSGLYSYLWHDSAGQTNNVATGLSAGTYQILATDEHGCMDSTIVTVTSSTTMTVNVDVTHESCPGKEDGIIATEVQGGQSPYVYSWSNGESTQAIENLAVGDYILTVSDADECIVTLIIPIENEGGDCIHIPTAISPNGDGANDTWIIGGIEDYPDALVEIYNRWGSLLFSSNDYQHDWDGTYNGENVSAGVYYYVITISEEITYTGSITVIR